MTDDRLERLRAVHEQLRESMQAWMAAEGERDPQTRADEAAEVGRRMGMPVVRAEVVSGVIVLVLARPKGHG